MTFLLAACFATAGAAGGEETLAPGDRIRITGKVNHGEDEIPGRLAALYAAPRPLTGRLVTSNENELSVELDDGRVMRVPRRLIGRLQVHDGVTNSAVRGAVTGSVGGAVLGAAAAGICVLGPCRTTSSQRLKGAAIGAGVFGSLGALVGLAIKRDRWREAPASTPLALVPAPRGIGALVVVSW